MNKTKALIISGIIAIVIVYFGYTIFIAMIYKHRTEFNNYQRYLWVFNDSVKKDIDTLACVGNVRESDTYYTYKLKDIYVAIWEFKDLNLIDLNKTSINQNINLDKLKFDSGEELNKNLQPLPSITVRFKLPFNDFLNINLNDDSKITENIESNNYKGFYGDINKMSFSDKKGEHLILFDYGFSQQLTLFLLYKGHKSFYVIMINSEKPFDESIINILNLK